jgi:hypothetical protein
MIKFKKLLSDFLHGLIVKIMIFIVVWFVPTAIWMEQIENNPWIAVVIFEAVVILVLSLFLWDKLKYSNEDRELDRTVFKKINSILSPDDSVLSTWREFDLDRTLIPAWVVEQFNPFFRVEDTHQHDLTLVFRNKKLEKLKKQLFTNLVAFMRAWSESFYHGENKSFYGNLEFPHENRSHKHHAECANKLGGKIVESFEKFYKVAQKELKIN